MKSLVESLFDKDLTSKEIKFGDLFQPDDPCIYNIGNYKPIISSLFKPSELQKFSTSASTESIINMLLNTPLSIIIDNLRWHFKDEGFENYLLQFCKSGSKDRMYAYIRFIEKNGKFINGEYNDGIDKIGRVTIILGTLPNKYVGFKFIRK